MEVLTIIKISGTLRVARLGSRAVGQLARFDAPEKHFNPPAA